MRHIDTIVIHCSATRETSDVSIAAIKAFHVGKLGWPDTGYHFYIRKDGTVEFGRPIERVGAHVAGHNTGSIGIAYEGGLDSSGRTKDTRTPAQRKALRRLLVELCEKYPITRVVGHRDLSPDLDADGIIEPNEWTKQCPCFDAIPEYAALVSAAAYRRF